MLLQNRTHYLKI